MEITIKDYSKKVGMSIAKVRRRIAAHNLVPIRAIGQSGARVYSIEDLERIIDVPIDKRVKMDRDKFLKLVGELGSIKDAGAALELSPGYLRSVLERDPVLKSKAATAEAARKEIIKTEMAREQPNGAQYFTDGLYMKLGTHNRVFYHNGVDWVASSQHVSKMKRGLKLAEEKAA